MRTVLSLVVVVGLTACGGPGGSRGAAPPVPPASSTTAPAAKTSALLRLVIPPPRAATGRRRSYVSPASNSVTFAQTGGPTTTAPIAAGSPNCATDPSGQRTCAVTVNANPGQNQIFVIKTFASTDGTGTPLSTASTSTTIGSGQSNTINAVLNGVVASLSLTLTPDTVRTGYGSTVAVSVGARDPSGYTIVGPGVYADANGNPVTLTLDVNSTTSYLVQGTNDGQVELAFTQPATGIGLTYDCLPDKGTTLSVSAPNVATATTTLHVTNGPDAWVTKASLPSRRYGMATAVVGNIAYAIGGANGNGSVATLEAYDPSTDTWTAKAPMPTSRQNLAAGVINNVIYAVGGVKTVAGYVVLNTLEAYDPATDTWTTKAPMPTARTGLAAGVVNGVLYAIGGVNGTTLQTVEAYDPATNAWTAKPPMPTARMLLTAGVVNNVIYAIGGASGFGAGSLNTTEAYDTSSSSWSARAPLTTARQQLAAAVVNNQVYAIGGSSGQISDEGRPEPNADEAYDPSTNTWATKACLATGRSQLGAAVVNGSIYTIGGYLEAQAPLTYSTVEASHP